MKYAIEKQKYIGTIEELAALEKEFNQKLPMGSSVERRIDMSIKDALSTRMKTNYEDVAKSRLVRRMPVIIRIDGRAFHTYTRGFRKPFDIILIETMQKTMQYLCENIQGCVLGYTQSDEISLLLIDYNKLESSAWFDYEVEKLCSISASMATMFFNKIFPDVEQENSGHLLENSVYEKVKGTAMFDSRCFNVPKEEVTNYFYWRQQDAIRNSVQMVAQANFSQKELNGKSCEDLKNMLQSIKKISWEQLPTTQQRGSCAIKDEFAWKIDNDIPIFKQTGRDYVEKLVFVGEE